MDFSNAVFHGPDDYVKQQYGVTDADGNNYGTNETTTSKDTTPSVGALQINSQTGASALMCSRTLVAFLPPSGVADPPPIRFFQDSDRILILCLPKFADTIHALLMF